jgi:hypothetical protein
VQIRAYQNLEHLQGSCVPRVLGAGSLDRGRTAFIAMTGAGINARELLQCSSPSRRKTVFSLKVKSMSWSPAVRRRPFGQLYGVISVAFVYDNWSHCKHIAVPSGLGLPTSLCVRV